uniref:CSON005993 protein n=1 Tax=Culicoides sonorensis TaxID=179676 RepID=A0A336M7R0_CULSO
MVAVTKKPLVNPNLITLKCVLFTFFGGLGCIFPFLVGHMNAIGLNHEEALNIQIIAPAVSIIAPLIVCFLADRWIAVKKGARYGSYIRILTAILILLAALFYALLLLVPKLTRVEQKRSQVSFACDADGAYILQEKCLEEKVCHHFDEPKYGNLLLTNCSYTCLRPLDFDKDGYQPFLHQSDISDVTPHADALHTQEISSELDYIEDEPERSRRQLRPNNNNKDEILNAPPHICIIHPDKPDLCHAYVIGTKQMKVQATLESALQDVENDTISEDWCRYPINHYSCNIPSAQKMMLLRQQENCVPVVECDINDPYSHTSALADTVCLKIEGDVETTVWSYFTLRLLSELFPLAALVLLDTSILIATRETSTGRGDVGHQLAWGSLGWAIFSPIVGTFGNVSEEIPYLVPIVVGVVLLVISAVILLLSSKMPLTPPEWWWHTKIGMLAIPMSAIRKYAPEVVALGFVSVILGTLWGAVDQYQWWHFFVMNNDYLDSNILTGMTALICALPAIPLLWYAERIVDYCGHNYILIGAFCLYVVRFIGLAAIDASQYWFVLFFEALESATLGLVFVTLVLYMRHLVPRRLIATGQAIPVIGHFGLGRLIGALIGLGQNERYLLESLQCTYKALAITAAVCATLYFLIYQFWLLPKCIPPTQPPPSETLHGQSPQNGTNGSYTPLLKTTQLKIK